MISLSIIAHCWRYAGPLAYQLASIARNPPGRLRLAVVVYFAAEDIRTADYLGRLADRWPSSAGELDLRQLPPGELCRRAIGRNRACLSSSADWLWLVDCDYVFGPGCLDALADELPKVAGPLAYPRWTVTTSQTDGDWILQHADLSGDPYQPAFFREKAVERRRNRRAIGGIQIYRGSVARERGYLPDSKRYQRPADQWRRTFEDRVFRGWLGTAGEPIELPNLFRIRHSQRGRETIGLEL